MNFFQQLAVVIGPVVVTAICGPILLAMMSKAKQRAESESYEVASDKARFEAMDLLVTHMRAEVDRLRSEASSGREEADVSRRRIKDLENAVEENERIAVDLALWALSLTEVLEKAGLPTPARPRKIQKFLTRATRQR